MSQKVWWLLEGMNCIEFRASNIMETLVQNCKESNSTKNLERDSALDPPEETITP